MYVQVELKNNELYKGELKTVDYNLNVELTNVTKLNTHEKFEHLFIRGSQIKFIKYPNELSKSPIFKPK